jgi:serine/threonine protein kinase
MEFLEGETLAARLRRGPLSLDDVPGYGQQIAAAIAAAHERGVVHRDLKPSNVMITRHGIKVLDFGLAKRASIGDDTSAETLTASRAIVGTPAYMAPEQLESKEVDARTDIFALGIILYEMATRKRPFGGGSQVSLIAEIMRAEVPAIRGAGPQLNHIVARCLAKDPAKRWQSASDVKLELEWAGAERPSASPERQYRFGFRWLIPLAIASLALTAAAIWTSNRKTAGEGHVYRFALAPPPDAEFLSVPNRTGLALSPDGRSLVFLAIRHNQSRLWIQQLDSPTARELPGTENASEPFWSPDGRAIGFFAAGYLKRIDSDGNNPQVLCEIQAPRGAAWGPDGNILFSPSNRVKTPLYRIPATGGMAVPVTTVDSAQRETYHSFPILLHDGKRFLYRTRGTAGAIFVSSFDNPKSRASVMPGSNWLELAYPIAGGPYAVWNRGETIVAQKWDPSSLRLSGEPVPLGGPVGVLPPTATYTISDSGLLVYAGPADLQLQLVDRTGKPVEVIGEPLHYSSPAISRDGTKVAALNLTTSTLLVTDVRRGVTTRIAENAGSPVCWSPNGRQLAFQQRGRLVVTNADGTGGEISLDSAGGPRTPEGWTPDGRGLLYTEPGTAGLRTLRMVEIGSSETAKPLLKTNRDEINGAISPDGRWLAYVTDESGREEVYVRKLEGGPRTQVSKNGGNTPIWRGDSKELFYQARDFNLVSVDAKSRPDGIEFSAPQTLFSLPASYVAGHSFDVLPDGKRFLIMAPYRPRPREALTVVFNWPALLAK